MLKTESEIRHINKVWNVQTYHICIKAKEERVVAEVEVIMVIILVEVVLIVVVVTNSRFRSNRGSQGNPGSRL